MSLAVRGTMAGLIVGACLLASGCASLPASGGTLDLRGRTLTPSDCEDRGLPQGTHGVVVEETWPGGPASRAGIRPGAVITSLESQPVGGIGDLVERTYIMGSARQVHVTVWDQAQAREVLVETAPAECRSLFGVGFLMVDPPLDESPQGFPFDLVADARTGPDRKGAMLLRLVGYMDGGGAWDARFLLFRFGRFIRPVRPGTGSSPP